MLLERDDTQIKHSPRHWVVACDAMQQISVRWELRNDAKSPISQCKVATMTTVRFVSRREPPQNVKRAFVHYASMPRFGGWLCLLGKLAPMSHSAGYAFT